MALELLTIVYGDKHVSLFEKACLRSLSLFHNAKALFRAKATWNVFTEAKDVERIRSLFESYLSTIKVNIRTLDQLRRYTDPVQSALVWQIEECLKNNSRFMMAPPDTFFSDKTVHSLLELTNKPGSTIAVAHPRVHESFLNGPFNAANDILVHSAFNNLHRSWSDAETGHAYQNTFIGGVEWKEIGDGLISVTHRLPTVYMINFIQADLDYFKTCTSSGDFDHVWPKELIKQNRYNYLGSSDAAFIAEITDPEKNVPPYDPSYPKDGSFWQQHEHNTINGMFKVIFKKSINQRRY